MMENSLHGTNEFYSYSEPLSQFPLLMRMMVQETNQELSLCTGFIYEYEEMLYLITNGHCLTGINPENNKRLSSHAAYPTSIFLRLKVALTITEEGHTVASKRPSLNKNTVFSEYLYGTHFSIYSDENYTQPKWFVHPEHGYNIDVVAIPLIKMDAFDEAITIRPINYFITNKWAPQVADEVYILGYPFGITDVLELPIWKRGSIASEPSIFYKGLPRMLVDTATRSGMSGSPVILAKKELKQEGDRVYVDTLYEFIGVYSGRIGAQEESAAQLGIVWRKKVIEEILAAKVYSTIDFQNIS